MFKGWMGVALLACWLGLAAAAPAQYLPNQGGPPRMPEPVPSYKPPANLVPGPISPDAAPPGPPDSLSLPACIPGAFQPEECAVHGYSYFHIGTLGLGQPRMGHLPVAIFDPTNNIDNGVFPARPLITVQTTSEISQPLNFGVKTTLGYMYLDQAIEFTGYFLSDKTSRITNVAPGRLNVPFINPPLGFEGDNGLWRNADVVQSAHTWALGNAEVNLRYTPRDETTIEPFFGFRYLDYHDRFDIFTDDDGRTFPDNLGFPDPHRTATYTSQTHSHMLLAQLGTEYQLHVLPGVALGVNCKGAWGANFGTTSRSLIRGDGFAGLLQEKNLVQFSHVYEIGTFVDIYFLERFRVRTGYNVMWLLHLPMAIDQANFDLQTPLNVRQNGNVFLYGPSIELQFLF
jgi:hypothetical protein